MEAENRKNQQIRGKVHAESNADICERLDYRSDPRLHGSDRLPVYIHAPRMLDAVERQGDNNERYRRKRTNPYRERHSRPAPVDYAGDLQCGQKCADKAFRRDSDYQTS